MARESQSDGDESELQAILDALGDPDCRRIVRALDEPMTAGELADACDIPTSTTYRKLELLSEASLLVEGTELREDGHHATKYRLGFDEVAVALTEEREFEVSLSRPEGGPEDRLATLWNEVRKQT